MKYACSKCGAEGVRLWRNSVFVLTDVELYCVACALQAYPEYGYDPRAPSGIGGLVAARPTPDGSFWGHTSGPQESVEAWYALPLARSRG